MVAMRKGHQFARSPTLAAYSRSQHLLVSLSGDPHGFVDDLLAKRGLKRRVVLTVPTFMMALAHLSSSDLIAALPRRLVGSYAARFGLVSAELPFKRKPDPIFAVATRAAMMDDGIARLMDVLISSAEPEDRRVLHLEPPIFYRGQSGMAFAQHNVRFGGKADIIQENADIKKCPLMTQSGHWTPFQYAGLSRYDRSS